MATGYQNFNPPLVFYSTTAPNNTTAVVSGANPSWPTPLQGENFGNCPLLAALSSITWVNRKFIVNNIYGPDKNGNYTFLFWDYGVNNPMTGAGGTVSTSGQINPPGITGTRTGVTVGPQVILNSSGSFYDSGNNGMTYGAGSIITNEVWPALFERAYAKFCFYEYGIVPSTGKLTLSTGPDPWALLQNPAPSSIPQIPYISGSDPAASDLVTLGSMSNATNSWGGNAGIGLMYLTGANCFQLQTNAGIFTVPVGSKISPGANSSSIYNFIKNGFCTNNAGTFKTMYPLVAWTGSNVSGTTLVPNHCYSILGTFDTYNGCINKTSYLVLRTTFGSQSTTVSGPVSPSVNGSWVYFDAGFKFSINNTQQSPAAKGTQRTLDLSMQQNSIFGFDASQFGNYFQTIAWAETF